ncbi:unnamed protein product, partial [marine sediment metagenome]
IDLIGDGWIELVRHLNKPWIACNRSPDEGGNWCGGEEKRIEQLLKAVELRADIIDIELEMKNLAEMVSLIKERAKCLLSLHEFKKTPPLNKMREIIQREIDAGADICKLVTTAQRLEDNQAVLQLIADFPQTRVVTMAMGPLGLASRLLCPLVGGDFTYASIEQGKESAPGQLTVRELRKLYDRVQE